jgi:hypothetical protein
MKATYEAWSRSLFLSPCRLHRPTSKRLLEYFFHQMDCNYYEYSDYCIPKQSKGILKKDTMLYALQIRQTCVSILINKRSGV